MDYTNYYYGMNIIWWGLGIILLFLIFLMPFESINQKLEKQSANNLLKKRLIIGDITESEYNDMKKKLHENIIYPKQLSNEK
ncbi:SHOCT domain-containing protein [Flavobacterium sp.]|jgi:putative membrane protein|uniref:SHOCT domain-containing protein n=1 Tax=Flavobacterium sp. TaxID=239 RepID=UPI0037C0F944